jgi:drug/metabolite transporter (DMT)-like permease
MTTIRTQLSWLGAILTAAGAILFAVSITALPVYYSGGGNVQSVLLARYALLLVFCIGYAVSRGIPMTLTGPQLSAALGSGLVFGAGGLAAIAAYAFVPVSLGVLIFYLFPLLTVLMEAPLDKRLPRLSQIACLIAALLGIALALELGETTYDLRGITMCVLGAAGVAASFVWSGRKLAGTDPMVVNIYRSACALGLAAGFGLASGSGVALELAPDIWLAFAIAVLASILAFVAMFAGVERIGASPAAMIMNLEPVVTMLLAAVFLGETATAYKVSGAAIIIGAILISQWLQARASAQNTPASGQPDVPAHHRPMPPAGSFAPAAPAMSFSNRAWGDLQPPAADTARPQTPSQRARRARGLAR